MSLTPFRDTRRSAKSDDNADSNLKGARASYHLGSVEVHATIPLFVNNFSCVRCPVQTTLRDVIVARAGTCHLHTRKRSREHSEHEQPTKKAKLATPPPTLIQPEPVGFEIILGDVALDPAPPPPRPTKATPDPAKEARIINSTCVYHLLVNMEDKCAFCYATKAKADIGHSVKMCPQGRGSYSDQAWAQFKNNLVFTGSCYGCGIPNQAHRAHSQGYRKFHAGNEYANNCRWRDTLRIMMYALNQSPALFSAFQKAGYGSTLVGPRLQFADETHCATWSQELCQKTKMENILSVGHFFYIARGMPM